MKNFDKKTSLIFLPIIILCTICGWLGGYFAKPATPITTIVAITQIVETKIILQPTNMPTYTSLPTYEPLPTYTPQIPTIVIITATNPPIPPTQSIPPTPEGDPLIADKEPGIYLVNIDIGPGLWRNNGSSSECYWGITTRSGEIINNFFGQSGGTMYIPNNAFQVEMHEECGIWTYLGPP